MHIEPGIVDGAKMGLAAIAAVAATAYGAKLASNDIRCIDLVNVMVRTGLAAVGTLVFFEIWPKSPVGVSEVHFNLGTTLFLILEAGPAAFCLLVQGIFFARSDMQMYLVNLTTILVAFFTIAPLTRRTTRAGTAYIDLAFSDVLKLSAAYQGGVITWVAFWVFYGKGVSAWTLEAVGICLLAYLLVIVVEPLVDLAALAAAKALRGRGGSVLVASRLYSAA